jgi:hypothetical protein
MSRAARAVIAEPDLFGEVEFEEGDYGDAMGRGEVEDEGDEDAEDVEEEFETYRTAEMGELDGEEGEEDDDGEEGEGEIEEEGTYPDAPQPEMCRSETA